jgi:hypothetical protein
VELILLYSMSKLHISFTGVWNVYFITTVHWIGTAIHKTDTVKAICMTEYDKFRKEFREFWVFWSYTEGAGNRA